MSVDGKLHHVRVDSHTVFRYYLHEDWRSVVFEQVSTYDVNGVKGYGIFEFLYRSVTSVLSFLRFAPFLPFFSFGAAWHRDSLSLQSPWFQVLVCIFPIYAFSYFTHNFAQNFSGSILIMGMQPIGM